MHGFEGIWIPLVTPFAAGRVDHAGLRRLVHHLGEAGVAGFVVCGSTGEAAALSDDEQHDVLRTVVGAADRRPVVMGASGVVPGRLADRLKRLAGMPLAGVLVPPPSYVRPPQAGVRDFFAAVADAAPCPVLLYDIPARTGVRIETATMLALAAHPNIRAVKDCSGDADHLEAILADGRLQVLAGDDHRIFATLAAGGSGAIAASAHLRPDLFVALHRQLARAELDAARALWRALHPLTKALFDEPSPGPVKAAVAAVHGLHDELREPMVRASTANRQRVAAIVAALNATRPVPSSAHPR
jgi:4-hydroxy-tetrahydrodipicolinate synthase